MDQDLSYRICNFVVLTQQLHTMIRTSNYLIKTLCLNLLPLTFFMVITLSSTAQLFTEVASDLHAEFSVDYLTDGAGISMYDFNHDGLPDMTACAAGTPPRIFVNDGSEFMEIAHNIPNSTYEVKCLLWVDYDNDGDPDVFLTWETAHGGSTRMMATLCSRM